MTFGSTVTVDALESDPYPIYERLRAEEPVSWFESVGLWLVTRWDDVVAVDKTPDVFTGETEPSTLNRTFGKNLLGSEGPYHDRIRSIIYPAFRVAAIGHYPDDVIAPLANELIDAFVDRGECDFVSEFAEPLSTRVVKRALGLNDVDDETLRRWFAELALGASNFEGDPEKQRVADAASAEAIEEGARWHSPVGTSTRQATRDTEVAGVQLEQGALIAAVLASANRDERNWTEPERYDVHRREGGHLAFATGPHLCIGARLGRYEARTAWRVLLDRLPHVRLDEERPIEISGWEFRSPHHLWVTWQ